MKKQEEWGYLFASQQALCEVLALKAELGPRTRQVYESNDKEMLKALISDYKKVYKKVEAFYKIYKQQWFIENKPHGFDIQDIRFGGLMQRIKSCTDRLQLLYDGKIDRIEELEETRLDLLGGGEEFGKARTNFNSWGKTVSANVITW